jgi:hypothetical protein
MLQLMDWLSWQQLLPSPGQLAGRHFNGVFFARLRHTRVLCHVLRRVSIAVFIRFVFETPVVSVAVENAHIAGFETGNGIPFSDSTAASR